MSYIIHNIQSKRKGVKRKMEEIKIGSKVMTYARNEYQVMGIPDKERLFVRKNGANMYIFRDAVFEVY
jgi:hypothetical protein